MSQQFGVVGSSAQPNGKGRLLPVGKVVVSKLDRLCGSSDFEDFFINGAVPLHLVGPDGTILSANKAELDLLRYTADEYVGRHISEFHADQGVITDILARLGRGEKLEKYPACVVAKDRSFRHVEITSSVNFRDGKFINTRCFTLDVTDLVRARQELRHKDEHLRQVLNALPAAVYTTDKNGTITYFNRAAAELAGREPERTFPLVSWRMFSSKRALRNLTFLDYVGDTANAVTGNTTSTTPV